MRMFSLLLPCKLFPLWATEQGSGTRVLSVRRWWKKLCAQYCPCRLLCASAGSIAVDRTRFLSKTRFYWRVNTVWCTLCIEERGKTHRALSLKIPRNQLLPTQYFLRLSIHVPRREKNRGAKRGQSPHVSSIISHREPADVHFGE